MNTKLWIVPLLIPNFHDSRWHSGPWAMLHGLAVGIGILCVVRGLA